MITALQNFISKKGKFVFILLLVVVIISFVLYLSQGTSIFDFFPDPNRQKKEFYGVDLNDPDQNRQLSATNRVASRFGAIIEPSAEAMEQADRQYVENMQSQIQAAFRAGRENIDQEALQRLFGYMQSWPNFPKSLKIREIARSGFADYEFSQSSIRAKIIMDHLADRWNLLPLYLNDPRINDYFLDYVKRMDPSLGSEENRTRALSFVGQRNGFSGRSVESILFSHFRANEVDRIFSAGAFALEEEAKLDLVASSFAWDADLVSLEAVDLNLTDPQIFSISFNENPKVGDEVSISYGGNTKTIIFTDAPKDKNGTKLFCQVGDSLGDTINGFLETVESASFGFNANQGEQGTILITPNRQTLPRVRPQLTSPSSAIQVANLIEEDLIAFHESRKDDDLFANPAKTFATAVTFSPKLFLTTPPQPDEARMRSYFERNRLSFDPPAPAPSDGNQSEAEKGARGPVGAVDANESLDLVSSSPLSVDSNESNESSEILVTFEQVKEQVRSRIIEGDRIDAERDAEDLAKEKALEFLDDINQLGDRLRNKYDTYQKRRNSTELAKLLEDKNISLSKVSFSDKDLTLQGRILGLETRESERRANREPLSEVQALNEKLFFTRSIRKSRNGFVVFILDQKTQKSSGTYASASFADLYREYADDQKADSFADASDEYFAALSDGNATDNIKVTEISISRKGAQSVRSSYDSRSRKLSAELGDLQSEREEISSLERDANATDIDLARKKVLDEQIDGLRDVQAELNKERSLAVRLAEACSELEADSVWSELERTTEQALFVRLRKVYSLVDLNPSSEELNQRGSDLELAKAERARDELLKSMGDRELAKED